MAMISLVSFGTIPAQDLAAVLTVEQINNQAADFVGKTVTLSGAVDHVCHHGGKRLFISSDTSDCRFKIIVGPEIEAFDRNLEGQLIKITGIILEQKVDKTFLDEWEARISTGFDPEVGHEGHEHNASDLEDHHESPRDKIAAMRKQLTEAGAESISFYTMECRSFAIEQDVSE